MIKNIFVIISLMFVFGCKDNPEPSADRSWHYPAHDELSVHIKDSNFIICDETFANGINSGSHIGNKAEIKELYETAGSKVDYVAKRVLTSLDGVVGNAGDVAREFDYHFDLAWAVEKDLSTRNRQLAYAAIIEKAAQRKVLNNYCNNLTDAREAAKKELSSAHRVFLDDLEKNIDEIELYRDINKDRIEKMEEEYAARLGTAVSISDAQALPGVEFAYALDISRCIGCRRCVYACVDENNQSRDPEVQWIRVLSMDKEGGVDFSESDPYYEPEEVPEEGKFYVPVQCQQCQNPPCTKVCPTGATWTEKDGIVVIDYDWCIGCRYCMAACPYGARHFNWGEPSIPDDELNPNMHYLGNRPRPKGVVEKCTFCIQRTREGDAGRCRRTTSPSRATKARTPGRSVCRSQVLRREAGPRGPDDKNT